LLIIVKAYTTAVTTYHNGPTYKPIKNIKNATAIPQGLIPLPAPPNNQCPNTPVHPGPEPKPLLKLPSSQQEWAEANTFFSEVLVPEVLRESTQSPRTEFSVKASSFFVQKYGTRKPRMPKQQQKGERHERALKKVKQLKNEASLYKAGICPRLSWLLTIEELPHHLG